MNLLIDESVDRQVVEKLRQDGHNVVYVSEMDPGISDDEVLSIANKMGALLVTADKDFGELVFRRQQINAGVLLIRLAGLPLHTKAEIVASGSRPLYRTTRSVQRSSARNDPYPDSTLSNQ